MSEEPVKKSFGWAEQLFANQYDVSPKYRDLLAMLAAAMMGDTETAQHFYDQAIADGASDEELERVASFVRMSLVDVGNLTEPIAPPTENVPPAPESSRNGENGDKP
ncbi:MAG TPA: hypothetical protein VFD70_03115 [Anaerolineae bacterium]|nr:hypothetical protein [Anaerolineae bacterium]